MNDTQENLSGADTEYEQEFTRLDIMYGQGKLDSEYSQYIMNNCKGERLICNGDMLVDAIESQYLYNEFIESMIGDIG